MYDVTAIGELLIDFAHRSDDAAGYPILAANPGGAPCNLLASLSAYGCKTAFLGKVGADSFGQLLAGTLKTVGIETSGVIFDPEVFTTLAFVTIDAQGNRDFSFARKPGADTRLRFEELKLELIDDCRDFHFGSLSLIDEPARTATRRAVVYAKEKGKLISFDPNLRRPLWADLEQARQQILWGLEQADIVKISDEEIDFLWQDCAPAEAAMRLHEKLGVVIVFITLGQNGCYYSGNGNAGWIANPQGIHTIDTTGAGDIFGGAALSQVLKAGKPLDRLTDSELCRAARFGCAAANLSTEKSGGISSVCPLSEVERLMEQAF